MKKLCFIVLSFICLLKGFSFMEENFFTDMLKNVNIINVYNNGDKIVLQNKSDFLEITKEFESMINGYREMPAFSVALHNETIESLKNGVFVEFEFEGIKTHNELPFTKLLIKVDKEFYGFNIIRFYDGEYSGRCFYIDLDNKNMENFYNFVVNNY